MSINLNATDVIAGLGAAAWIPQIITWVYNAATKPVLTITPDRTVSIGYTLFGPIFNLRLSINVDKKDTLIDFIGVEIQHESGTKHTLEWTGMTEFFSEVKNSAGDNQIIQRDIVPISVKLSTLSLIERFFRFQDSSFIQRNKSELDKLMEQQQFMQNKSATYHDDFLSSKEVDDYIKFMRSNFYWQAGSYTASFLIRSPAPSKLKPCKYQFKLTQDNVDMLKKNLEEIKADIEYFIKKGDAQGFNGKPGNWRWVNVNLNKCD
ncbi:MAG: hypothetical protein A3F11_05820 [Gammaproteobacteria bacterium RIFCSPHIGHO2_12_FULL_37_14]|nr:MAG: hypothetical protein A3F11_05820 [Gammaproteobacteria bacterium RIFCSPHIGHO2_12_FULL_37_14]